MLDKIKEQLSLEFWANVEEAQKTIKTEMQKIEATDDLNFVMEHAASSENNGRLRAACIYALCFYYKFFRIGFFYVPEYRIKDAIEKIEIPEEVEIKKLLEEGLTSTNKDVRYWAEFAFMPMNDDV